MVHLQILSRVKTPHFIEKNQPPKPNLTLQSVADFFYVFFGGAPPASGRAIRSKSTGSVQGIGFAIALH
jgi:hypothetical protein